MNRYNFFPFLLLVVVACLVSVVSGKNLLSQLGDIVKTGNKNDAKQQQKEKDLNEKRRRLLEDKRSTADVDMDAATGTVHHTASKKDATCDGQLASALVQANDLVTLVKEERDQALADHKSALEKIYQLEKNFAQAERNVIEEQDSHHAMEIEMTRALKVEKERSTKKLEELDEESAKVLGQVKKELKVEKERSTQELAEMEEESARVLEQVKNESDDKIRSLRTEKDEIIASLEEKQKISVEELESILTAELEKAKEDKETNVAAVEADRDAKVTNLTAEMSDAIEKLKKERDTKVAELTATMKEAVENLERDRDSKVAKITQTMQLASEVAEKVLRTTKNEAQEHLSKQMTSFKDEMVQAKVKCNERLIKTNKKISSLQELTDDVSKRKSSVEKSLHEAKLELEQWRSLYSDRSYCNMTYIANDVYVASANAYSQAWKTTLQVYTESQKHAVIATKVTGEHVSNGLEYSSRFINHHVNEHWPTIQPYYKEHITDNYEAHIEPHLRQHLFPRLNQACVWYRDELVPWSVQRIEGSHTFFNTNISPSLRTVFDEVKKIHPKMVGLYGDYCSSSLQEFLKISKESDMLEKYPPPTYFMESWKQSCAHPRESMSALMQGTFVLLLIAFRRRILGLLWRFVRVLLSIIIHLTPLRFVFLRRTNTSSTSTCPSSVSLSTSVDDTDTVGSSITKIEAEDDS